MTRSILRSSGWLLGAVVALALVVGVVAMPTDAHACGAGCEDASFNPKDPFSCGGGGAAWCQICTFCY
jgi:hypothetical protein